ncbi:polyprenyl synthetase family protein [Actinocrispum wychmicini]|uniref:Heptaprenyl diphosphate synthase n=1 Tax=Actinocrispum wychmicini TaxID=1213861 RepID=A0A4R2K5X5_9PSEU|nr:polyprenyl synthetase family protein [Actinocrispum wychmicini]TCO65279.1 heptaprenyl diphosphate synthase [Actinocrispum wychmicini]
MTVDPTPDARLPLGLSAADPDLVKSVTDALGDVEKILRGVADSDVSFIDEAALHLVNAGGKRFRPLFTLIAAHVADGATPEVVTASAAVELVHLATLYHDDVMDEATMRRGAASVNARWDNTIAILTGDFLFAHASGLVADLGTDAARIIAETFGELVTGQMRETVGPAPGEDPVDHYLSVIGQKTGSLIATAGRYGGMFSNAAPDQTEALYRYGKIIGAAFQISDDIIDIASPAAESGKTPGTDLREGVKTLPMLYALSVGGPEFERLSTLLAGPITDDAEVAEALDLLRGCKGMVRARETLEEYAERAHAALAPLPECPARDALELLTRYVIERSR